MEPDALQQPVEWKRSAEITMEPKYNDNSIVAFSICEGRAHDKSKFLHGECDKKL